MANVEWSFDLKYGIDCCQCSSTRVIITRYKNLKAKTVLSFKGAFQVVTDFRVANLLKVTAEQE